MVQIFRCRGRTLRSGDGIFKFSQEIVKICAAAKNLDAHVNFDRLGRYNQQVQYGRDATHTPTEDREGGTYSQWRGVCRNGGGEGVGLQQRLLHHHHLRLLHLQILHRLPFLHRQKIEGGHNHSDRGVYRNWGATTITTPTNFTRTSLLTPTEDRAWGGDTLTVTINTTYSQIVGDSSWTFPLAYTRHEGHHHPHDPLEPRSMFTAR
jgi:hypothetical protein